MFIHTFANADLHKLNQTDLLAFNCTDVNMLTHVVPHTGILAALLHVDSFINIHMHTGHPVDCTRGDARTQIHTQDRRVVVRCAAV